MPLHDIRYQHWEGEHLGLWRRRWVIAGNGIRSVLQTRGVWQMVALCWVAGLVMAAALFLIGQLLVADSIVVQWAGNLNPQLQNIVRMLTTWLAEHPEISVRTTQNLLFHYFCIYLLPASIFILGFAMPLLITRDLASNAIIIYSSKALNRGDYFIGKFSMAFGLLCLTWLGPVCGAWITGNLLAPDWRFFWHSRAAIGHAVLFGLISMTALSLLALGISATSNKEKSTPGFWLVWWIVGFVIAPIASHTQPWLRHLSFNYNLNQLALGVFRPGQDLQIAQDNIPMFGELLKKIKPETMNNLNSPPVWGSLVALVLMAGAAAIVLHKRVKPE